MRRKMRLTMRIKWGGKGECRRKKEEKDISDMEKEGTVEGRELRKTEEEFKKQTEIGFNMIEEVGKWKDD
jgi:hypothetical protein